MTAPLYVRTLWRFIQMLLLIMLLFLLPTRAICAVRNTNRPELVTAALRRVWAFRPDISVSAPNTY